MLSLFFLGPSVESYLRSKKFFTYYLICGFGAAALHLFVRWFAFQYMGDSTGLQIPVVGASGAITGIFVAFALLFPNQELYLFFIPFPIKAKYLVLVLLGADLLLGLSGASTGIAHFAHLGGAIAGALLILYWKRVW